MTYENLKRFDIDSENVVLIKQVRQLLYDFSYSDLEKKYAAEHELLRKSIINYLYSGNFTLEKDQDLNEQAKSKLKNAILKNYSKDIVNLKKNAPQTDNIILEIKNLVEIKKNIRGNFDFDNHFYKSYFQIWNVINLAHIEFIKSIELVNYLLIYEAPPFSTDVIKYKDKYFLTSNKKSYASAIKTCFNSRDPVQKVLIDNNVAYFDLIMGCLPIADEEKIDLRYKWCYMDKFKIGGKALPIVLLELGICYVLKNVKKPIIKFPKIAIGTPVNTSRSIFEYYADNPMKVLIKNDRISFFKDFEKRNELDISEFIFLPDKNIVNTKEHTVILCIDISGPNSINGFKKYKDGVILPLHKANIVSASNSPNGTLLKNAYDNY